MAIARGPSRVLSWSLVVFGVLALGCPGDDGTVASTSEASTSGGSTSGGTSSSGTTASPDSSGTSMGMGGSSEGSSSADGSSSSEGSSSDGSSGGAPTCGNGVIEAGEDCDDGGLSLSCDDDCTPAQCGDGTYNPNAGELCDEGMATTTCDADCTPAECQDGTVNAAAGELCDEGSQTATCDLDCTPAECGDAYPNELADEQCDGGGETAFCNADCTLAECGDGVVNLVAGEACDEAGNTAACDDDCTPATCGDGYTNGLAGEQCDDGNGMLGDGCDACQLEVGPGDCNEPYTTLSTAPSGLMVQCDDPTNTTCEQDMEIMCPPGWGLCSRLQHVNRNTGWNVPVGGADVVLGEIYCRNGAGNGAGHYALGPYDGVTSLASDPPVNCGYGSSRTSCPSGFGCNELASSAICCAPTPSCGNGVVDSVEEECDDGNANEDDDCLDSCSWRIPAAHGVPGVSC